MNNPISTYRIQFHSQFTFADLEKIIPYLEQLGVRTIYASPVFEATPGSQHGYDGTNPNRINPEIGTEAQLSAIAKTLAAKNMCWLQDIVPNHLAFHETNEWLMDVLEKGKDSAFSHYFDIDWEHPAYPGKLMVPFPGSTLEEILKEKFPDADHYIVRPWQETDKRINYRRFFLVNGLICINIQHRDVFDHYHQLVSRMTRDKVFQGLRVDHIDGLHNPTKYLNELRELAGDDTYITVEKILEPDEEMAQQWPVQGNSGYDFLGVINNLFTSRASEAALQKFYKELTGDITPVEEQISDKKSTILKNHMQGELDNLVRLYNAVSNKEHADESGLKQDIAEYLIKCPVYRYYDDDFPVMDRDREQNKTQLKPFYTRCMQFSGPLMAKGVEDTLMYTYNKFIGHNEVGDSPAFFGCTVQKFHGLMKERQQRWPLTMNASSTHDTKRGEDVRARLNAMSCLHEEWISLVKQWRIENEKLKSPQRPDANDEYFIYQTLVGSYPGADNTEDLVEYPARIAEYLQKAFREAKRHTNWSEPNEEYEQGAVSFTQALVSEGSSFLKTFLPFFEKVRDYGMINSFGQLILKFTCPGVPDVYQGTELWDLSLVDPDNRRPVDYNKRMQMLSEDQGLASLWRSRRDGGIKLSLLHRLLKLRNRYANTFTDGDYLPVDIRGQHKEKVVAFLRKGPDRLVLVVVPLEFAAVHHAALSHMLPQADWGDTAIVLPEGNPAVWTDELGNGEAGLSGVISVNRLFRNFPAAIFTSTV